MDPYALKHALAEVDDEIERADIDANNNPKKMDWAFKILLISEHKQLNKNLQRLNDINSSKR